LAKQEVDLGPRLPSDGLHVAFVEMAQPSPAQPNPTPLNDALHMQEMKRRKTKAGLNAELKRK